MRRVTTLVLLIALLGQGAHASAQEEESEQPAASLPELTAAVRGEIELLAGSSMLAADDLGARITAHRVRIDHFVGTVRQAAERTLRRSVSVEAVVVLESLPGSPSPEEVNRLLAAADLDALDRWHAVRLAPDWLEFAAAVADLRSIGDRHGPDRVCPVRGEVWFVDDWGDGRPGNRSHKGTDLMAPRGTPVQAIEDGVVVQANWHWQGGRQIYVRADATGDVYYYAHLDHWEKWIWTGTRVAKGDVMGLLGSSGNADGPHLHFGWMPGSRRVDLNGLENPYPLLNEICTDRTEPPVWFVDR